MAGTWVKWSQLKKGWKHYERNKMLEMRRANRHFNSAEQEMLEVQTMSEEFSALPCSASSSWPMAEVLGKLCEAADILLDQKDYDGHGHELIEGARREAREYLKQSGIEQ